MKCPYCITNNNYYPDQTCRCIWSYCMHPTEYTNCDIYKRQQSMINMLKTAAQGGNSGKAN